MIKGLPGWDSRIAEALAGLLVLLCVAAACSGDEYLILKLDNTGDLILRTAPNPALIIQFNESDTITEIDLRGDTPKPPTGDRITKLESVSKSTLSTADEARTLSLLIKTIKDVGRDDNTAAMRSIFTNVIPNIPTIPKQTIDRYTKWKSETDKLISQYDQAALADVLSGLQRAWNVQLTREQIAMAKSVVDGEQVEAAEQPRWLQIVLLILRFLIENGILFGGETPDVSDLSALWEAWHYYEAISTSRILLRRKKYPSDEILWSARV